MDRITKMPITENSTGERPRPELGPKIQLWQLSTGKYLVREIAQPNNNGSPREDEIDVKSEEDFHAFVREEVTYLNQLATLEGQTQWRGAEDRRKERKTPGKSS